MDLYEKRNLWENALSDRKFQHFFGSLSAFFFTLALLSLFDGLQDKMRAGPQELDLLPGEELTISGPCPIKNPVNKDVISHWFPEDAPISFTLEGFYNGYWFGSGMWRGKLQALNEANSGTYSLRIAFRGAPAQALQNYTINLYKNKDVWQSSARSLIFFLLALNPFMLAAFSSIVALLAGMLTYFFGMRYSRLLGNLNLAEVYRVDETARLLCCVVTKKKAPPIGAFCDLVTTSGRIFGSARVESWQKGKLTLLYGDDIQLSTNDLVCLNNDICSLFK